MKYALLIFAILLSLGVDTASHQESYTLDTIICPTEPCEEIFLKYIQSVNTTLFCALYDIDNQDLLDTLTLKSKTAQVEVLTEKKNGKYKKDFIFYDKNYALMHNKFCIIDHKIVITGSTNPTKNGFNKNNNVLIVIKGKDIAKVFQDKYLNLKNNPRNSKSSYAQENIKLLFCPEHNCQKEAITQIRDSKKSIYFATFAFTDPAIATELILAKEKNVSIKGIIEKRMFSNSVAQKLLNQNIFVVFDHNKNTMHHKYFVIDEKITIIGSYNPTKNGNLRNDENVLIIKNQTIAKELIYEFEKLTLETYNTQRAK